MKFNPSKIKSFFLKSFLQNEGIDLGTIKNISNNDFINFMEKWVKIIDSYIVRTKKYSPYYQKFIANRCVSYNEYQKLFLNIEQSDFIRYIAYEYFMIKDKTHLASFLLGKNSSKECYIEVIQNELQIGEMEGLQLIFNNLQAKIPINCFKTHAYISGSTGSGKSELMKLLLYRLINNSDATIIVIDPHGKLVKESFPLLMELYPDRTVYIDPYFKNGYTPVFNPLSLTDISDRNIDITAQNLSSAFCELLPNELSVNMKTLLMPCLSILLRKENSNLTDFQRLIKGDKFLLDYSKSNAGHHRLFFENYNDGLYTQTKSALFTKLQSLLNSYAFHNCIVGENTINLEKLIQEKKIILFNLAKGKMGEEHSQAFGKFILAMIKSIVMKREKASSQTFLFIDEAHNFISQSMENIITETRKYNLSLLLASQFSKQLGNIEETVLSNVATVLTGSNNNKETFNKITSVSKTNIKQLQSLKDYHFHYYNKNGKSFVFKVSDELVNKSNEIKTEYIEAMLNDYYSEIKQADESNEEEKIYPKFGLD